MCDFYFYFIFNENTAFAQKQNTFSDTSGILTVLCTIVMSVVFSHFLLQSGLTSAGTVVRTPPAGSSPTQAFWL